MSIYPVVCNWIKLRKSDEVQQKFAIELREILTEYIESADICSLSLEINQETMLHIDSCVLNDKNLLRSSDKNLDSRPYSVTHFATFYSHICRYSEAESLYTRALAGNKRIFGERHLETLKAEANLGNRFRNSDRHSKAEALYRRALIHFEEAVRAKHPDALKLVGNRASLYLNLERYDDGELCANRRWLGMTRSLERCTPRHYVQW